jgi:hypothetical protein
MLFCQCISVSVTSQKSKSKLYYNRQSVGQSVLVSGTHWDPQPFFPFSLYIFFDSFGFVDVRGPSLTRSSVCTFQFLPGIASTAFLRSESHGTHEYSLLSLFLRLPQPGGPGSCIYLSQERMCVCVFVSERETHTHTHTHVYLVC